MYLVHFKSIRICEAKFMCWRQTVESYAWEGWQKVVYPQWDSRFLGCVECIAIHSIKSII